MVGGVCYPWGISISSKQQLVVAELSGAEVAMFDRDGKKVQTIAHEAFSRPIGVAMDKDDNIYVSDYGNSSLFKVNKEGKLMKVVGRKGTRPGEFSDLTFIKVINSKLYVCDRGNGKY